jgi:hypothetical protein
VETRQDLRGAIAKFFSAEGDSNNELQKAQGKIKSKCKLNYCLIVARLLKRAVKLILNLM